MKKIMLVKPKTVNQKDRKELEKNGFTVIEHPFPSEVKIVTELDGIQGDVILMSAIYAISQAGTEATQATFFRELNRRIYKPFTPAPKSA